MLDWINQNPGLIALIMGAAVLLAVWIGQGARRRESRRESRMLLERMQRETERQESDRMLLNQMLTGSMGQIQELSANMEARQDRIRNTLDERLAQLAQLNEQKLDQMRKTVSEKLETTLEGKIGESFKVVSSQLSQVYKGLGEMQTLAGSVGDLKKVLTNVKTRGVWGEVRLRALLAENFAPGQYVENAQVKPASAERVEFAIRLPSADGDGALLPVDSKFPQEDYLRLVEASEQGDQQAVLQARQQLERAVTEQARRVSEKYVSPPATTDFAILFLPYESLYSEVIRISGLAERLQDKYRVMLSGPVTLSALITSLQTGFKGFQLQRRSAEVLKLLLAVRQEFEKYATSVQKARERLEQAGRDLDQVDTRTRAINRKLRDIGQENAEQLSLDLDPDA